MENDKWIKCEDAFPEKSMDVLIFGKYSHGCPKKVQEAYFDKKGKNKNFWFFYINNIKSKDVTHWMPLPNPPQ